MTTLPRTLARLAQSRQGKELLARAQQTAAKPENQARIRALRERLAKKR